MLLKSEMGLWDFVESLVANKQYLAGIDFVAHALPAREAVWWGCLCLQDACGSDLSDEEKGACQAAVQWILEPTESNKSAAKAPGEALGWGSIAGALAIAVNKTTVSHTAGPGTPASPELFEPAKAVAMAVKHAAIRGDPVKIADRQRLFIELGTAVAKGVFTPPALKGGAPGSRRSA